MSSLSSVSVAPSASGCGALADHVAPRGSCARWVCKSVLPTVFKEVLPPIGCVAIAISAIYMTAKHVTTPVGHRIVDLINPGHEHAAAPSLDAAAQTALESALAVVAVSAGIIVLAAPVLCVSSYKEWKSTVEEVAIEPRGAVGESIDQALPRTETRTFSRFLVEKGASKTALGAAAVVSVIALTFFIGHKIVMVDNEASHLRMHKEKPLGYVIDGFAGTFAGVVVGMGSLLCCMIALGSKALAEKSAAKYHDWKALDLSLAEREVGRAL